MLGKQAIINAITRLNDRSSTRIITDLPGVNVQSATREEILARGLKPYCENNALSLGNPGCVYKALHVPSDTPVISDVDRQQILDALCCFYDFGNVKPSSKGELMDAWNRAVASQPEWRRIYWPDQK